MQVENVMSQPAHVLPPEATATEAAQLMRRENIGCIVVERGGKPEGLVTDRDLALRVIGEELDADEVQLEEIMSPCPIYVLGGRDLRYAMEMMREQSVRRLPVVDGTSKLVGVVSLDDIIVRISQELDAVAETIEHEIRPDKGS